MRRGPRCFKAASHGRLRLLIVPLPSFNVTPCPTSSPPRKRGAIATSNRLLDGFPDFTNEVQHLLAGVLRWDSHISTLDWTNGARLPSGARPGNRSGKSRRLWIARHQALLGS